MLKALSNLALTTVTANDSTLSTIALGVAILALLIGLMALSRARRAGNTAQVAIDEALTAATTPIGSMAAGVAVPAAAADDLELVAVISAAIATVLADEQGAGAAAPRISSIRPMGAAAPAAPAAPVAAAQAAAAQAAPVAARPSSGPYAGFVVRRIRRV